MSTNSNNNNNDGKQVTNKSGPLVKEIQRRFGELVKTQSDQFDEEDIKRVMEDDFFVKRFLLSRRRNVDSALKMLIETLKWIKRENFRRVEPTDFPAEFYFIGALFDYEPDLEGNFTIYIRVKYILRCGPLVPHAVQWASKFFYDLDVKLQGAFYTVLIDFQGCGLKNAEFEFIWHAINTMRTYLPACLKQILIIDLPKIFKFGWIIVKKLVPESERSLIIFVSRNDVFNYIHPNNVPNFMGGQCSRPYQGPPMVPKGCPSAIEYGLSKGVPLDQCLKVAKIYEPIVKEYNLFKMVDKDEDIVSRVESELKCRQEGKPLTKPSLTVNQCLSPI